MSALHVVGLGMKGEPEAETKALLDQWQGKIVYRLPPAETFAWGEPVPGKEPVSPGRLAKELLDHNQNLLYCALGTPLGEDCLADALWELAGERKLLREYSRGQSLTTVFPSDWSLTLPKMVVDSWLLPDLLAPSPRCRLLVLQPAPVWVNLPLQIQRLTGSRDCLFFEGGKGWCNHGSQGAAAVAAILPEGSSLGELAAVMKTLRSPQGCPWDRQQSHTSLRRYLLEEAYETAEAIDEGDDSHLQEELGDLLLQVVFHAQIAAERKAFGIAQVLQGVNAKLISRHPHVFAREKADTADDVLRIWGQAKAKEQGSTSILKERKGMPALNRAERLQAQAAAVGFDWDDVKDVMAKVEEELAELKDVYPLGDRERIEEEMGDIFFSLVNLCRFLRVDPEAALTRTITKFSKRFQYIEDKVNRSGGNFGSFTLKELDMLWEEAKSSAELEKKG